MPADRRPASRSRSSASTPTTAPASCAALQWTSPASTPSHRPCPSHGRCVTCTPPAPSSCTSTSRCLSTTRRTRPCASALRSSSSARRAAARPRSCSSGCAVSRAESRWLAETARGLYVAFDGAPADQDQADFLSYQQLLETIEVPTGRPVAFRDFLAFFERHRQNVRFADAHQCFEEIRGVLTAEPEGPLSRELYLALGVRQSMFDEPQRAALYDVFERYRAWLPEAGLYEPNLVAREFLEKVQPVYDFVASDEVQDLTNVQLALVL